MVPINAVIHKIMHIYLFRELDVIIGSAHTVVMEVIKCHKLCVHWVPRMLTEEYNINPFWHLIATQVKTYS